MVHYIFEKKIPAKDLIESLYEEFGQSSPIKLTEGKTLNHSKSSKVKKKKVKSSFKDTKIKKKVKRK